MFNMKLLITKTGFQAVTHDIAFQPQTELKAKKLVLAQHVLDVGKVRVCPIFFIYHGVQKSLKNPLQIFSFVTDIKVTITKYF